MPRKTKIFLMLQCYLREGCNGVKACQEGLDDVDVDIDFDANVEFDVEVYLGAYVFSICLINVSTIHCLKKS